MLFTLQVGRPFELNVVVIFLLFIERNTRSTFAGKMLIRRMTLLPRLIALVALSIGMYCLLLGIQRNRSFGRESYVLNYKTAESKESACSLPSLSIFTPEIMQHLKERKRLDCGDRPDWVYVRDGSVRLQQHIVSSFPDVRCSLQYVTRKTDHYQRIIAGPTLNGLRPGAKLDYDFFVVRCRTAAAQQSWSKLFASIRTTDSLLHKYKQRLSVVTEDSDLDREEDLDVANVDANKLNKLAYEHRKDSPSPGVVPLNRPLNVLFYGLDSLSRVHFMRKLPKTYQSLTEKYNASVLQMYNIVGDGSPQALIPILTGQTELELPLTLKNQAGAQFVDVYPFIWNNFSDHGYVTQYGEDTPNIGTFTYRMKGFDRQPTDFYLRPFYLQGWSDHFSSRDYCYAGRPRHSIMMEWARELFETYERVPKYSFNFHAEISHDDFNLVQIMDDDLVAWLDQLDQLNVFNTSLVIFMSDHGARFSSIRSTLQGKFEERLPFFSIMVPSWFAARFPNAYHHLQTNAASRFMTPFDIYSTVMTVLTHFNRGQDTPKSTKVYITIWFAYK